MKINSPIYPKAFIRKISGILLLTSLFSFNWGCEQPDLGLEVQNPSDAVNLLRKNDLSIRTSIEREDSVKTDELSLNLLGAYNDPILGSMRAGFYTQLRPTASNIDFGDDFVIDSLVLVLPFRGFYGDLTKLSGLQKFSVYRVTEDFTIGNSYYSNDTLSIDQTPIGQTDYIVPLLLDSANVTGKKEAPQLRIKLQNTLGQEIHDNPSSLIDGDAFVQFFKGIYVVSQTRNTLAGEGAVLDFSLTSGARIDLFYKNASNDSLRVSLAVNENCARFTRFNHTYSNSIETLLANPTLAGEETYVQTMAGLRTRIDLPDLKSWQAGRKILVNEARIFVPVDIEKTGIYAPNPLLNLITKGEDGTLQITPDLIIGDSWAGGYYDAVKHEYIFNVSRYIQGILNNLLEDRGLFIQSSGSGISSFRVPLKGGVSENRPVRVELLYQVLSQ